MEDFFHESILPLPLLILIFTLFRPQVPEKLMYDVYKPHPNFRKTDPGRPHHRILVIQ